MINYDEMNNVIKDLNNYVAKIQKIAEVQQKLDTSINDLIAIKEEMKNIEKRIDEHSKSVENILSVHENIKTDIESVLQDYKKLNSAFELVEIELKKVNVQNEETLNDLKEIKQIILENQRKISDELKNINKTLEDKFTEIKNDNDKQNKKLNNIWGTLIGVGLISIFLLILNLVI